MDQPSSAPSSSPSSEKPPVQPLHSNSLTVVLSVVIIVLLGVSGYLAWQHAIDTQQNPTPVVPIEQTPSNEATSTPVTNTSTVVLDNHIDPSADQLNVAWKAGTIVAPRDAFGSLIPSNDLKTINPEENPLDGMSDSLPNYTFHYDYYNQGQVTDGRFKDYRVYGAVQTEHEVDLGMDLTQAPPFLNLLVSPDQREIRIVGMSTSTIFAQTWPNVVYAPNLKLNVSNFPETLTLANGKTVKRAALSVGAQPAPLCGGSAGCLTQLPVIRTADGRGLYTGPTGSQFTQYTTKPGCLILYRENGEGMIYESAIASAYRDPNAGGDVTYPAAQLVGPAQLHWNSAYASTSTFRSQESGGCGGIDCMRVLSANQVEMSNLVQAGTTDAGDPIYVYKPSALTQHPAVIDEVYDSWYQFDPVTNQKLSYDVFLRRMKVPAFLWQDAAGRWAVYKNSDAVPLAECGKPVIYLYPTKTEQVQVRLPSFVNVTVSEPAYPNAGWNVAAEPSGKLTLKDGSSVNSLYWEGVGVNYSVPTTGFVVRQSEVASFLRETLPRYGLNAQETQDFMDFWLPKFTGAPYYRLSFLTNDWNKAVPLNVSPAPKTTIRLFMDWQRLAGPIDLVAPKIETPTRDGFTLVEWGGLLH